MPTSRLFADEHSPAEAGAFSFFQISDSHIGFSKPANMDVTATLKAAIDKINVSQVKQRADLILPGWREEVEFARFLPEMTVVHAIPTAAHGRPDVDALSMPSVAIAGDWVGPEAMLADAAVASGIRAARRLVQEGAIGRAA